MARETFDDVSDVELCGMLLLAYSTSLRSVLLFPTVHFAIALLHSASCAPKYAQFSTFKYMPISLCYKKKKFMRPKCDLYIVIDMDP